MRGRADCRGSGGDHNWLGRRRWCHSRCCDIDSPYHTTIHYSNVSKSQGSLRRGRPVGRLSLSTMPRAHDEQPQGRRSTPWQSAVTAGNPKRARGAQDGKYQQHTAAPGATAQACLSHQALSHLRPAWQQIRVDILRSRRGALSRGHRWLGDRTAWSCSRIRCWRPRHSGSLAAARASCCSIRCPAQRAASGSWHLAPKLHLHPAPAHPVVSWVRQQRAWRAWGLYGCYD